MGRFGRDHADGASVRDDAGTAPSPPAMEMGAPGRCPVCDGFGYIDHIDMVNRVQRQHCRSCRHRWEFSFDDDGVVIDLRDGTGDAATAPHQQLSR